MKKIISLLLVIALTATISIAGTAAYLTDTDSDVNVMTMGNVNIEQLEYERVVNENGNWVTTEYTNYGYTADEMQQFTQAKPALPAVYQDGNVKWDDRNGSQAASGEGSHQQPWSQVGAPGSNQLFDDSVKNVIDKFVFVENTGWTDAYYRTLIAVECPEELDGNLIHSNINSNTRFTWADSEFIYVNGTRYLLMVATYNEVLTPGEISRPSLLQLFLDPAATNEDCALFGGTWEVLVLSQAVQSEGFTTADAALDEAFGDPMVAPNGEGTPKNAEIWMAKVLEGEDAPTTKWSDNADTSWYNAEATEFTLDTAAEVAGFAKLVNDGNSFSGKTIKLGANIDLGAHEWTPIGQTNGYYAQTYFQGTFDGNGKTISNLSITSTNDGGNYAAGFFGFLDCGQSGAIKNVTFNGATVNGHHWTGVAAGYLSGDMENVTVKNATVTCTHVNNDACGDKAGAVVGYVNGTQGKMTNCVATNCTVSAGRDAGQVVGAAYSSQVVDCSASMVTVTASAGCTDASAGNNIGGIIGRELVS